jgi:hypothetical protein
VRGRRPTDLDLGSPVEARAPQSAPGDGFTGQRLEEHPVAEAVALPLALGGLEHARDDFAGHHTTHRRAYPRVGEDRRHGVEMTGPEGLAAQARGGHTFGHRHHQRRLRLRAMSTAVKRSMKAGWIIAGLLALALAIAVMQYGRAQRPVVMDVAGAANATMTVGAHELLTVDPSRARFVPGFEVIGGTRFEVAGRAGGAVVYARGTERITYATVSGTENINNTGGYTQTIGKRELRWQTRDIVQTTRGGRNVVITFSPYSERLRRIVVRLTGQ